MKLQKTQGFASIYLLTILAILGLSLMLGGCAERQTSSQAESSPVDIESVFENLSSLLMAQSEEKLPNGTISQSQWSFSLEDCDLIITENISYKRTKAPFGGFDKEQFASAWQSERTMPLAQLDATLLQQKGLYLRIHSLDNQNLIKEESHYAEAYLAYYQAENGQAHPTKTDMEYNLINLPIKEEGLGLEAIEELKKMIIHCQEK